MIQGVRRYWKRYRSTDGQIIIFAAVLTVAMVGMLGLAIDLGYSFAQKRSVQNAADAAAIAGARAVTQWSTSNTGVTALPAVQSIVSANNMGKATQHLTCYYVDDANKDLKTCDNLVPATATGVRLQVSETHSTFFIWIIPGAPKTATTSASAIAHAQIVTPDGSQAPFILCGSSAKLEDGSGTLPILTSVGSTYQINSAAVGKTFEVHGPQIDDCNAKSNSYKGFADDVNNVGKTVPAWMIGITGTRAGPVRETVNGIQGCNSSSNTQTFDCVMYVPLAISTPAPVKSGQDFSFYVVSYAAMQISSCGANCHQGKLLDKYIIQTPSSLPAWVPGSWVRGQSGIISIRLTK